MCRTARARTPSILSFLHLRPGVVGLAELMRELHQPVRRGLPDRRQPRARRRRRAAARMVPARARRQPRRPGTGVLLLRAASHTAAPRRALHRSYSTSSSSAGDGGGGDELTLERLGAAVEGNKSMWLRTSMAEEDREMRCGGDRNRQQSHRAPMLAWPS